MCCVQVYTPNQESESLVWMPTMYVGESVFTYFGFTADGVPTVTKQSIGRNSSHREVGVCIKITARPTDSQRQVVEEM